MNNIILNESNRKKVLRRWILLCLCSFTLFLSACSPQSKLPDDDKPKPNPDDPGLIDDNPDDPKDVDPNKPGELVFTKDIIINLGSTKTKFEANDTVKYTASATMTPIDFSGIQWIFDFYMKNYLTLENIFKDYPSLKDTKQTVEGNDTYTFADGSRLLVMADRIDFSSDYLRFSVSHPKKDVQTTITQTPPYEIIVIGGQIMLINEQKKVVKFYHFSDGDFSDWKYGDFLGNGSNQLALYHRYSGNVTLFTLSEQGLTLIDLKKQFDELDALSRAVLNGFKFFVHFNEQQASTIQNMTYTFSSDLPTKLLQAEYPPTSSINPLEKNIYTTIDPDTSKAIIKVRWYLTNDIDPQIQLAEATYEFIDSSDLTKLKLTNVLLRYSYQDYNNIPIQVEDLVVYDGNQVYFDTRSNPQDIVKAINSDKTLNGDLEMPLVFESKTKKGLSLTFNVFDGFTDSHIYKITDPRFSFNNKYKLGLTYEDLVNMLGLPDLEGNEGVHFKDWTNDQRWTYFVATSTGSIFNKYYGFYKLVFIFKDGKVSEMQLVYYYSSI